MGRIYPAKQHLRNVVAKLVPKSNYILLKGSPLVSRGLSDQQYPFDQESNFYYCTGAVKPDWILLYDINKDEATLFIPELRTGKAVIYLGQLETVQEVKAGYDVDHVFYHDDVGGALIASMTGIFHGLDELIPALTCARSVKDEYEVGMIRRANEISCQAHAAVAKRLKSYKSEREAEAEFLKVCAIAGTKEQSYSPIFGAGRNASILHYGANDASFGKSELLLVDAACQFNRYAADVTRTYPISGRFSRRARILYETVLQMQIEAIDMLRPGVSMQTLQDHVHRILSRFLVDHKLVRCNLEVCEEKRLSLAFMPHGLGHHIGLDVHDVTPSAAKVPTTLEQAALEIGNVVTIEPGIYFNEEFLSTFSEDLNQDVLAEWMSLGGVRIEDCLLITQDGSENLTSMAKSVQEIENLIE